MKYFLLGSDAIRSYNNEGIDSLLRIDKSHYKVVMFSSEADFEDIIDTVMGWGDHHKITKEEYEFLQPNEARYITPEGFCWKIIGKEQARIILETDIFDLYQLYSNDAEGQIEDLNDLNEAIKNNRTLAIEVGYVHYTELHG